MPASQPPPAAERASSSGDGGEAGIAPPPGAAASRAARIKDANVRYHDVAAPTYDAKWGIDLGEVGQAQVRAKLAKALGGPVERPFGDALEVGAGTGYFALNLLQLGLIERATATDISAGMLTRLRAAAAELGLQVRTVEAEAEELPFADATFDLVFGHAVLHHIPNLDRAFAEFARVLRPGGAVAFCGEPSRNGDAIAALPKRLASMLAPGWRLALGAARPNGVVEGDSAEHGLESEVDVHAFAPGELRALLARAGFTAVRVAGEELLANGFGWLCRTLEASAEPEEVPMVWRNFAFRGYLALQRLDAALLEPRLPAALFYNLVLSGRKAR
jgi:SAM-dependent methyltransferase